MVIQAVRASQVPWPQSQWHGGGWGWGDGSCLPNRNSGLRQRPAEFAASAGRGTGAGARCGIRGLELEFGLLHILQMFVMCLYASTSLGRRLVRACAGGEFVGVVEPQAAAAVVVSAVMFGTVGMGHWRGCGVEPGWVDGSRAA